MPGGSTRNNDYWWMATILMMITGLMEGQDGKHFSRVLQIYLSLFLSETFWDEIGRLAECKGQIGGKTQAFFLQLGLSVRF